MKQKHYSMLLFFAAAVFVAAGLFSRPLLSGLKQAALHLSQTGDVEAFIEDVDTSSKNLSYKGELIDLYSLWYRVTDTREVVKEDATVLRLDNDFLAFQPKVADGETLREMADAQPHRILLAVDGGVDANTHTVCKESGADVLVAGSAYFKAADRAAFVKTIQA